MPRELCQREMYCAGAERIAQLCVVLAFFAGRRVRCMLFLMLLQRMAERMRRTRLLRKQQRGGAEQR